MPVSIVVGGQYGSEGKGKVAHYFAREKRARFVVRCGGPNSGHTVIDDHGRTRSFQQLPAAAILQEVKLAICAGSYIDLDILFREMDETNVGTGRLFIDPDAVVISEEMKVREVQSGLIGRIGSTGSGTGAAVAARINRVSPLLFAKDISELKPFISNISEMLRSALDNHQRIIIEGTQGFGLSPIHSRHYPYATSRDTTAAAFLAETGLSPLDVDDVILTIRAFPIRVGGNSGPLAEEIDWETVTLESGSKELIVEYASVTQRTRRVARFHPDIVKKAIEVNSPTTIVLNHLDYLDVSCRNAGQITPKVLECVAEVEKMMDAKSDWLGCGPATLIKRSCAARGAT